MMHSTCIQHAFNIKWTVARCAQSNHIFWRALSIFTTHT